MCRIIMEVSRSGRTRLIPVSEGDGRQYQIYGKGKHA